MKFTKVHSLGNDFIVIDEDDSTIISEKEALVRQICKRHTGIGADGLLFLSTRDENKDIFDLRIFNADGTEPAMSGSGLRCASAFIYSQKKINSNRIILNTTIAIGDGRIYFIETNSPKAMADTLGRMPVKTLFDGGDQNLVALDTETGKVLLKQKIDISKLYFPATFKETAY